MMIPLRKILTERERLTIREAAEALVTTVGRIRHRQRIILSKEKRFESINLKPFLYPNYVSSLKTE